MPMLTIRVPCALLALALPAMSALAANVQTPSALRENVRPYLMKPLPTVESIVGVSMPPAAPMYARIRNCGAVGSCWPGACRPDG